MTLNFAALIEEVLRPRAGREICDEVDGIVQTGPFGSQLHERDYVDTGIPVVMPKDIIDGRISQKSIARISETDVNRLSRHVPIGRAVQHPQHAVGGNERRQPQPRDHHPV